MSAFVLPEISESIQALNPIFVGNSARLGRGGGPLHVLPELMTEANEVSLHESGCEPDPQLPGSWTDGTWRIWPAPSGFSEALAARVVPVDSFGVDQDGEVVDPLGGFEMLSTGVFVPGDAAKSDPLTVLKFLALCCELDVEIGADQKAKLVDWAPSLLRADRSHLRYWLTRLLVGKTPSKYLRALQECGGLPFLLPEVTAFIDFHRNSRHHHKDVWEHTLQVVDQAVPRPIIRWAALLHDIGKVSTRSYAPGGKVHFFRHDEVGAYMFEGIAVRLNFSESSSERIRQLILHHLRPAMYEPGWSDGAVRRFSDLMGPAFDDLIALGRADITTKRTATRRRIIDKLAHLSERVRVMRQTMAAPKSTVPKGLGLAIIDELGITPGPRVGELRSMCLNAQLDGRLAEAPSIGECIAFLRAALAA